MAEGRDYPVEYAVNLSLAEEEEEAAGAGGQGEEEEEWSGGEEAALVAELKERLARYSLPGLASASFQQLNAKAAIAAAHHRAYIQVGSYTGHTYIHSGRQLHRAYIHTFR